MKRTLKTLAGGLAVLGMAGLATQAQAKDFYKMSTLGPGSTPYVVMSTFAKIVNTNVKDTEIQVNATGVATRHALDAARGKIDFFMSAESLNHFMKNGLAMYKKVKDAPKLFANLRSIVNFPIGSYHIMAFADSGINSMKDIKGKKVFVGPPAGAAKVIATAMVEAMSGLKSGKDFTAVKLGWSAAAQAFQDRQLDVYINPTNAPSPVISQIALTNKVRFFGLSEANFKVPAIAKQMKLPGRSREQIDPKVYGKNAVNTKPVTSIASWVGIGSHKGVNADAVYKMTKAFWSNLDEVHAVAPWLKIIQMKSAFNHMTAPLHPGAAKYYKEAGAEIPAHLMAK